MKTRIIATVSAVLASMPVCAQSELANEAVEAMAYQEQLDRTFEAMEPSVGEMVFSDVRTLQSVRDFVDSDTGSEEKFVEIFDEEFLVAVRSRYPLLREALATELDKGFSAEELEQLINFYRSPIGQKLIEVEPELVLTMSAFGERVGVSAGSEALDATLTRIADGGVE